MDTRENIGGTPMKTVFHLPRRLGGSYLSIELGVHRPSSVEPLAPFYQDPTQRIVVLDTNSYSHDLVVRVTVFLELFEDREGTEIGWDEWKHHVVMPSTDLKDMCHIFEISGCRLFFVSSTGTSWDCQIRICDFSMQGRAKYSSERENGEFGVVKCMSLTGAWAQIPRNGSLFSFGMGTNGRVIRWPRRAGGGPGNFYAMSIWTF